MRSCRATRDRVGPNAAGLLCHGGTEAVVSESHPSGERRRQGNIGRGARCRCRSTRPARAGRPEHHHRTAGKDRNSSIGTGRGHHELRTEKSTVTSVSSSRSPLVSSCFVIGSSARWTSGGSAHNGAVCRSRARGGLASSWAACRVPRLSPGQDDVSCASRPYPWRLTDRRASRQRPAVPSAAHRPSS